MPISHITCDLLYTTLQYFLLSIYFLLCVCILYIYIFVREYFFLLILIWKVTLEVERKYSYIFHVDKMKNLGAGMIHATKAAIDQGLSAGRLTNLCTV